MKDEKERPSCFILHPSSFILANMDETLGNIADSLRGLPMPELRKDPIVGRWVIIATDRAKRPVAPRNEPLPTSGFCPFCEGNEDKTPQEILAYRDRGTR